MYRGAGVALAAGINDVEFGYWLAIGKLHAVHIRVTANGYRELLRQRIAASPLRMALVTHGTDTMVDTGHALKGIPGKVIVLTGALSPYRFRQSDATFNIGCAIGALQVLPPGVYIAMSGRVFAIDRVRKNREARRFEEIP